MAVTKVLRVDFFEVSMEASGIESFDLVLQLVGRFPDDESRILESSNDHPIRFTHITKSSKYWHGDMVRMRMDQLPKKGRRSGPLEAVNLEEDEGIGEESAFFYVPELRTLCVQYNRTGVLAPSVERYFNSKVTDARVLFKPQLTEEGYKKLATLREVRKIEVAIASTDQGSILEDEDLSIRAAGELMQRFGAPSVSYVVSMEKSPGSLDRAAEAVQSLFGLRQNSSSEVRKLILHGNQTDEERFSEIDLLPHRMYERVEVVVHSDRTITYDARLRALKEAWAKRQAEVASLRTRGASG